MRRFVSALGALVILAAARPPLHPARTAHPATAIDYSRTIVATPDGGFRIGSATAPVKLVEYASLTCPHCRDFHADAWVPLRRDYIIPGLVSYEYRSLVLNGADIAASVLARCDGPSAFFPRVDVFYQNQPRWFEPFTTLTDADFTRINATPAARQLLVYASAAKLDAFVGARGIAKARFTACLSTAQLTDRLTQIEVAAAKLGVTGTPTFFIDGKRPDTNTWPGIEPLLRAALKLPPKA